MEKEKLNGGALQCDLHTHSVFSDGTYTPEEIAAEAKRLGLIVALTDHNTIDGLPEFMGAAQKMGVTAVPGVEFSTDYKGRELHLIGLFILPEYYAAVEQLVKEQHSLKEASNRALVERLNAANYRIDYETIRGRNPKDNINRAHVAAELKEQGYVPSVKEAFDTLLKEEYGFYVPPARLRINDVILFLRSIRALPILAHPLQQLTERELREILPGLIHAGLVGVETMHSAYTPEMIRIAETVAREFALLPSGGSDFHGSVKPNIVLGTGAGQLCIPDSVYFDLLAVWEKQGNLRLP